MAKMPQENATSRGGVDRCPVVSERRIREFEIKAPPVKRLLTFQEAAAYLGLATKTLYNRLSPKAQNPLPIPVRRIGRKPLIDIRDLEAYVDSLL